MLPHSVAVAPDVDDVAVVQQPVDERRRHHLGAEQAAALPGGVAEAKRKLSASGSAKMDTSQYCSRVRE